MDDILNEFKEYLVKQGYKEFTLSGKPSTVYDYAGRIKTICEREGINTAKVLINRIDELEQKYGETGSEAAFGRKSHNSCINAIRRFNEFVKSNKLGEK